MVTKNDVLRACAGKAVASFTVNYVGRDTPVEYKRLDQVNFDNVRRVRVNFVEAQGVVWTGDEWAAKRSTRARQKKT
jgi:hypothetical protein